MGGRRNGRGGYRRTLSAGGPICTHRESGIDVAAAAIKEIHNLIPAEDSDVTYTDLVLLS